MKQLSSSKKTKAGIESTPKIVILIVISYKINEMQIYSLTTDYNCVLNEWYITFKQFSCSLRSVGKSGSWNQKAHVSFTYEHNSQILSQNINI